MNCLSLDYNFISAAARYGDHDDNCEETDLLLIRQKLSVRDRARRQAPTPTRGDDFFSLCHFYESWF
jgi:hypothetical protein